MYCRQQPLDEPGTQFHYVASHGYACGSLRVMTLLHLFLPSTLEFLPAPLDTGLCFIDFWSALSIIPYLLEPADCCLNASDSWIPDLVALPRKCSLDLSRSHFEPPLHFHRDLELNFIALH